MQAKELLNVMHLAERLKDTTRHCYTSGGRHESVAEHSWRIALMAYFVRDEFPEADMDKVIRMCLIHDLGEIFTGDIPTFLKTKEDERKEEEQLYAWVESLPEPYNKEMLELYGEMTELKTAEARIYKAMDSLEAVIQHNESDIGTWAENEYDLNLTYANNRVEFSPYLKKLRQLIREETTDKIEQSEK
ncbi:MAG: HD domain-containing protein [Eubacteriales bacterium]|nr:HD domain-containing protein [Eubacteriales bacterium]